MADDRTDQLRIRTPEGIEFSYRLAGPPTRFLAWAIDAAAMSVAITALVVILYLVGLTAYVVALPSSPAINFAIISLSQYVLTTFYAMAMEWLWQGRTLGKWVMRLRVINEQGLRLQFSQVAIRNLMRFIDAMPYFYLVGGLACVLSKRAQRLGDFVGGTVVIREAPVYLPDIERLLGGKYNSFRDYPHLEARLRRRVSPDEARLALAAVVRRDSLEPVARVGIFRDMAAQFRSLVAFPEDATFALTDEQYVRNVVDVLFRPRNPAANPAERKPDAVA